VALGLRRLDGLSRQCFADEFGEDPVDRYADAVRQGSAIGLLAVDRAGLRLTSHGRLLASEVLLGFLPAAATRAVPA
jgi:coproporphyrinogen III oxidase-like Fe-S oxidoreductase